MRKTGTIEQKRPSNIQCLEVVIPKTFISNSGHHFFRTLSLYSLHNHPVADPDFPDAEIFHFMVYDWKRTIKALLEDRKIPFTVLQYFTPDTIYYETLAEDLSETVHTSDLALAGEY